MSDPRHDITGDASAPQGQTSERLPDELSIDWLEERYRQRGYVADRPLAAALFLALRLERPLLLEGEAGVGKTEVAKVLASVLGTSLIRLQCYEGLDVSTAVYEWNYPRQMLEIRLMEARGEAREAETADIFTERFLIRRPLLQAIEAGDGPPPVLLIDEVDRADEEFEAYLLELLAEYQVTIPELGSLRAAHPPRILLTSNRTREVHDALKRRCLYHWIDYPGFDKELAIVRARIPGVDDELAARVVAVAQRLRRLDLVKAPGVAETLEWVTALLALGARELSPEVLEETFGVIVKYEEDLRRLRSLVGELLRTLPGADDLAAG
jgi:MoxR-like ATPase